MLKMAGALDVISGSDELIKLDIAMQKGDQYTAKEWKTLLEERRSLILQRRHAQAAKKGVTTQAPTNRYLEPVRIVRREYLEKDFKPESEEDLTLINSIVKKFTLNEEQERAFRIVANHAVQSSGEQLKMYLGGMAGTGKSQVIKSLIHFFEAREESYRFMCLAPTGAAASLIAGSTYHSVLNLGQYTTETMKCLAEVQEKLKYVDYIFLDEISMVDCQALFKICARMCKAMRNEGDPFGGINMICAGDFAQLPPAGMKGYALYSKDIATVLHTSTSYVEQEAALGKTIWHQFTIVVILRQNMRQRQQTVEDQKFRTLLENLRYKACTKDDIDLLLTRVCGPGHNRPQLNNRKFRDVSIITRYNSTRDQINEECSARFARETKQTLKTFYSADTFSNTGNQSSDKKRSQTFTKEPVRRSNVISDNLQQMLWDLPHEKTAHHPGKLSICLGMPIMIKYNEATECGVTNGAEGIVTGWQSRPLDDEREALDVLFVKLTALSSPIKIEGLPENVVPISHMSQSIKAKLVDGSTRSINRDQVPVIPNFAMTDFACQGRTRAINVCDLHSCDSHFSMYTCLSRGSSYKGTVLIQGFNEKNMVGGLDGYIRQEFRDLEMLDEITKLRYEKQLPDSVYGITRKSLIYSYRMYKGQEYIPRHVHSSIHWTEDKPYELVEPTLKELQAELNAKMLMINKDGLEDVLNKIQKEREKKRNERKQRKKPKVDYSKFVPAQGSVAVQVNTYVPPEPAPSTKRKRQADEEDASANKKTKLVTVTVSPQPTSNQPVGFIWSSSYSCAYDSLFSIIHNAYYSDPDWNTRLGFNYPMLDRLCTYFDKVKYEGITLEYARDSMWQDLCNINRHKFPRSQNPTSVEVDGTAMEDLCDEVLKFNDANVAYVDWCKVCQKIYSTTKCNETLWTCTREAWNESSNKVTKSYKNKTMQNWVDALFSQDSYKTCPSCEESIIHQIQFTSHPYFVPFVIENVMINISHHVVIQDTNYRLCGLIYFGGEHFITRIVDPSGQLWLNDSQVNGRECKYDGNIVNANESNILKCKGKMLKVVLYCKALA